MKYLKKDIANILKLSPRTISFYTDMGVVIPDIANPTGRGKKRVYSEENLIQFLIVKRLKKYGISLKVIKSVVSKIDKKKLITYFKESALLIIDYTSKDVRVVVQDKPDLPDTNHAILIRLAE